MHGIYEKLCLEEYFNLRGSNRRLEKIVYWDDLKLLGLSNQEKSYRCGM
jgi:hypothetical protein